MRSLNHLALISLLLGLCAAPLGAAAQASGDLVVSHSVEVVFPAAVVFQVDLAAGMTAVNGVELELVQNEQVLFDGRVDAENLGDEEGAATLYFDWPIPPDAVPELFTEVTYEWRILLDDEDEQARQGTFLFQPGPGNWRIGGEEPLRLAVVNSELNLSATHRAVLPAYELFSRHTGLAPDLQWVVLPRDFSFCTEIADEEGQTEVVVSPVDHPEVAYPCAEAAAERILTEQGYAILQRGMPGLFQFQNDVLAALFDVFYADYWMGASVPAWFETGLKRYYSVNPEPLLLRQVQEAARASLLYDAEQLRRGPVETDIYDLWTAQSATLVLFLADRYGADMPFTLAQEAPADGFEVAFSGAVGLDWDVFLAEWDRWLFSDSAARAAAWTVYQPVTATPSPPPATLTPVPSLPATMTLIPSAAPEQESATEIVPTVPAVTGMPPTTNTPRPPGSLETRVPATSAAAAPGGGTNGLCGAALPAIVMPGFALIIVGYRRNQG
ncbi:MAG: hypothetical protein JXN59_13345 [Anaerolineae bacterium]|nr:hypothetical protein [Anaerolineae bacterium]